MFFRKFNLLEPRYRLFVLSFLVLFLELTLIRWIPSYIRLVGYFSNLIILATFLGIGLGFLLANSKRNLLNLFPIILVFLIGFVAFSNVDVRVSNPEVIFFKTGNTYELDAEYILPVIFVVVSFLFASISQEMARVFGRFKPLTAYSLDIFGSIAGVLLFFCLSLFSVPAYIWFLVVSVITFLILPKKLTKQFWFFFATLTLIVLIPAAADLSERNIWSPYYRISRVHSNSEKENSIKVNNIPHQSFALPESLEPFYSVPYNSFPGVNYEKILIVGAGGGNDVALALQKLPDVKEIDAVEIDPVIADLGKKFHPAKPYNDARVRVYINDARNFLENSDKKYDLIIYALPDSLTLISNSANLRLESFLFTEESFQQAKEHLKENGLFVLYNYYREDWLIDKISLMIEQVFGEAPYVSVYGEVGKAAAIMVGPKTGELATSELTRRDVKQDLTLATDNWPFLYLKKAGVPNFYLKFLVIILGISAVLIYLVLWTQKKLSFDYRFFFFGAAFLLLETKSLVTFGLLFGSTWVVNSLVFVGVLLAVLLAVWISYKVTIKALWRLYILLIVAVIACYLVPPSYFLDFPTVSRYLVAISFYFAPIFIANLIFSQLFKKTENSQLAFGSNLLGAVFGGIFEYSALAVGYRELAIFIGIFYLIAFLNFSRK